MDRTEEEGAMLLAPLKDAEPSGKSGVDVTRAMRTGRKHNRRRVVAGVVAAASLTVLPLLVVPALLQNSTVIPASPGDESFDVMKQVVSVGSAGGFTPTSYTTGELEQVVKLRRADGGSGSAKVAVYPRNNRGAPNPAGGELTEDVYGRTAFWQDRILFWEWADGAWAAVESDAMDADIKDRMRRVAESVRPEPNKQVTVPFTMPLPTDNGLRLTEVSLSYPIKSGAMFVFKAPDPTSDREQTISVGIVPAEAGVTANTSLNNHPALANSNLVRILDTAYGMTAFASSDGKDGALDLLPELAGSVQLERDPAKPETWPMSPWR